MTDSVQGYIEPGGTIAGFVVVGIAGRGGMGVVYRARQKNPDRVVALKVIAPDVAADPAFRARFERESAIAAKIEHPNVIPVYAAGSDGGILFIAMRFINGTDLSTLIAQEGRLEPRRAAAIADQVAQALDAAHDHGLVHRDVKPANILLSRAYGRDHVYLTDFGLARPVEGSELTASGAFLGTPDYASPEQVKNVVCPDRRTDVYSLGCVLFQALVGKVPFPVGPEAAKLLAHLYTPAPSVREIVPDVPEELASVVMRAMAKAPDERYQSAGEFGRAALGAAQNLFDSGGKIHKPLRRVLLAVAAAMVAAVAAGVVPVTHKSNLMTPVVGEVPPPHTAIPSSPRRPVRVLLVIDASLSMNRPLSSSDRQRRIDAAKEWAPLGLPYLDFRDDIGVWTFATGRYPFQQQLTPLQPATDLHKVEVKASLRSLEASRTGGTPLYATIAKAIEAVQVGWRKDARNVVIVLTDGREHTSDLPEMRQRALRDLGTRLAAADRKKSVQVFITTVPPDARCTDLPERFRADCSMAASSEQLRSTFAMTLQRLGINVR